MANQLQNTTSSISDVQSRNNFVDEIVNNTLNLQECHYAESDSEPSCSNRNVWTARSFVDKRLQYWKNMIRHRRALRLKMCVATNRDPQELLFNADNREEQSVKRILDHVSSSCLENYGSRPQKYLEIINIPRRIQLELQGAGSVRRASKWCESKVLASRILEMQSDIQSVLDNCPDIDDLEVVGRNLWVRQPCERFSGHTISDLSTELSERNDDKAANLNETSEKGKCLTASASQLAVLINGTTYRRLRPEFSPILERRFVCNPYEYRLRTIMRIENNGREIIHFRWSRSEFFAYNNTLFNKESEVFVFDATPFQLSPGGVREVSVFFRPCKVGIVKQRWYLRTTPQIFYRCPCALTLNMHGRCTPPVEYLEILQQNMELTKRHCQTKQLWAIHEMSLLKPPQTLCPFDRELDESEVFNQLNSGFFCKRASDLQGLKNLFERCQNDSSCDIEWDYSVSMLIKYVCATVDKRKRIDYFEELELLLSEQRGKPTSLSLSDPPAILVQNYQTIYIYVRGLISSCIDLWEEKMWLLAEQVLKSRSSFTLETNVSQAHRILKKSKYFQDSMYIYTYDQLCDIAENIVSVIESSKHV